MTQPNRIVVLGAGYAGLMAAKQAARLLRRTNATVTLVNASDRFVERVRLHQLATAQRLRDLPLTRLLGRTDVRLVVATVTGIDPDSQTVRLDREPYELGYDTLVYALGSGTDLDTVPGVREHAFGVGTIDEAARLRDRLSELDTMLVVGGGPTGIESATEIAGARPGTAVTLLTTGELAPTLSDRARRHLRMTFARQRIRLLENTAVQKVGPSGVLLADGTSLEADGVLAATRPIRWSCGRRVRRRPPGPRRQPAVRVDEHQPRPLQRAHPVQSRRRPTTRPDPHRASLGLVQRAGHPRHGRRAALQLVATARLT